MNLDIRTKSDNISVENCIILKIKDLINLKNLEPGDKLPSERSLSEKFEVSRNSVRAAIQRLEFYGLLNCIPQSGTFVADIGVTAMNGMIDDILGLDTPDFKSLVETRILLELKTAKLAAMRRTDEDLKAMREALEAHKDKVTKGLDAVQEDLLFHLAIAKACGNSTINTFMLIITPEIITNFETYHVCDQGTAESVIVEHQQIYDAIESQDTSRAKKVMKAHLKSLYQYCYNL